MSIFSHFLEKILLYILLIIMILERNVNITGLLPFAKPLQFGTTIFKLCSYTRNTKFESLISLLFLSELKVSSCLCSADSILDCLACSQELGLCLVFIHCMLLFELAPKILLLLFSQTGSSMAGYPSESSFDFS